MTDDLDIRLLWKSSKAKEDPTSLQINMMERKGTRTTLYWIRVILWIEFWLTIVGAPIAVYLFSTMYNRWFTISYGAICILYLFYYQFLIRKIERFNYDGNVVESLRSVYGYLRFYLLHYKIVIWLSLTVGFVMGLIQGMEENGGVPEDATIRFWAIVIGGSVLVILLLGGLFNFLIHLIYGRKIKRLKGMVKALESEV